MRSVFGSVLVINGSHLRRSGKCDPYLATALPYSDLSGEDQRNAIQIWMQSIFAVTPAAFTWDPMKVSSAVFLLQLLSVNGSIDFHIFVILKMKQKS